MPVARDITASYRGPGRVMRRLLGDGPREDRALAFLMGACLLTFASQLPPLSRQAHLDTSIELNALLAGALFGWLFIAPLFLYALAALSHLVARLVGGRGSWYGARLALFWSFLASTPLLLLNGLVRGFIGAGPAQWLVGLVWLGVFLWFWLTNLTVAEKSA